MRADAHDQMLLTRRPTTVITQGTAMLDRMPMPYGSQDDEESLFAGIGNDAGFPMNAAVAAANQGSLAQNVPAVMRERAIAAEGAPAAAAPLPMKTIAWIGGGLIALSMLGFFKGR